MKNSFIEKTYVVGTHWNFQCVPTTYVTENQEENIHFSSIMSIVFTSFNISNCQSALKYLSLYSKLFIFT